MKLVAGKAPKLTLVAPVNPDPVTVTTVPTGPDVGENEEITGAGGGAEPTVNAVGLWRTPPGVVTVTGPVVAPKGTVVVIWASESTLNVALVPLNCTWVAPVKPEPEIRT